MKRNKTKIVDEHTILNRFDEDMDALDLQKKLQLEDINSFSGFKAQAIERELARLTAKHGQNHPRVKMLKFKVKKTRLMQPVLEKLSKQASIQVPKTDERTWMVHGVVTDADGNPNAETLVGLVDKANQLIRAFDLVKTNEQGYYFIKYSLSEENIKKMEKVVNSRLMNALRKSLNEESKAVSEEQWDYKDQEFFVTVLDNHQKPIIKDERSLEIIPGTIDVRQITLPGKTKFIRFKEEKDEAVVKETIISKKQPIKVEATKKEEKDETVVKETITSKKQPTKVEETKQEAKKVIKKASANAIRKAYKKMNRPNKEKK